MWLVIYVYKKAHSRRKAIVAIGPEELYPTVEFNVNVTVYNEVC